MVELEYNGERYMVDGGQWYRRLKVGECLDGVEQWSHRTGRWTAIWQLVYVDPNEINKFRIPCTDPRQPFVVGQRVKVARKDESWAYWETCMETYIGIETPVISIDHDGDVMLGIEHEGDWNFPPWCLDPVDPVHEDTLVELEMERIEREFPGHMDSLCGDEPATRSVAPLDKEDELTPEEQREFIELQKMLASDNDPELDHILRKLKPLTHLAADVRRVKRECYQKLAELLPEEKR